MESYVADFVLFLFAMVLLILAISILTYIRYKRLKEEHKRWLDIKELENDYDVFVTDEY